MSAKSLISTLSARDDGVSAVFIALVVTFVIVPVAAVSVDLSNAYSNRRHMQNAADAAAAAGAQELVKVLRSQVSPSDVGAVAWDIANANDAPPSKAADRPKWSSPSYCWVVKVPYPVTSPAAPPSPPYPGVTCEAFDASPDLTAGYNAVSVVTHKTISTFFAGALGLTSTGSGASSTSAGAPATAAIQKVVGGWANFAACSSNKDNPPLLLQNADGTPKQNPDGSYVVNPAAIGTVLPNGTIDMTKPHYTIWGTGNYTSPGSGFDTCGMTSSNFNGLICPANSSVDTGSCTVTVPGTVDFQSGTVTGPTLTQIAGTDGCSASDLIISSNKVANFSPCTLAIPICYTGSNSTHTLQCVAWGAFYVAPDTSGKAIIGAFLGIKEITNGVASGGTVGAGDSYRIALVQ